MDDDHIQDTSLHTIQIFMAENCILHDILKNELYQQSCRMERGEDGRCRCLSPS